MKFRKKNITRVFSLVISATIALTSFCTMPVRGEETNWIYVDENIENKGYINLSSYKSRVNVRENATSKSNILGKLCAGDVVKIIDEEDDYYRIEFYNNSDILDGYVYKDYIVIPERNTEEYELMAAAVITLSSSSKNRNYNMSLACSKINGQVLKQGEKFNWYGENGVGNANKENGFKIATVIDRKKYVNGYGGGVCQVSTALYNAIIDLGIEPDELHHHSLNSSYVDKNMDATVAYPNKNFIFTNTKDYAIEIEAFSEGGQVTILLYKVEK